MKTNSFIMLQFFYNPLKNIYLLYYNLLTQIPRKLILIELKVSSPGSAQNIDNENYPRFYDTNKLVESFMIHKRNLVLKC